MLAVTERHKLLRNNLKCMSRVTAGILQQSSAGPPKGCAGPVANHSQGTYDVIIVKQEKRCFTIYCILSCSDAARTYIFSVKIWINKMPPLSVVLVHKNTVIINVCDNDIICLYFSTDMTRHNFHSLDDTDNILDYLLY